MNKSLLVMVEAFKWVIEFNLLYAIDNICIYIHQGNGQ